MIRNAGTKSCVRHKKTDEKDIRVRADMTVSNIWLKKQRTNIISKSVVTYIAFSVFCHKK